MHPKGSFVRCVVAGYTALVGLSCGHRHEASPFEVGDACQDLGFDSPGEPGSFWYSDLGLFIEGTLCPRGDTDWYWLSPSYDILNVRSEPLVSGAGRPTYSLYESIGNCALHPPEAEVPCNSFLTAPLPSEFRDGEPFEVAHCVEPGRHFLAVHDQQGYEGDNERAYRVSVSDVPSLDIHEPNNRREQATPLSQTDRRAVSIEGRISCRGDQDWFELDGFDPGQMLEVSFYLPATTYQPRLRLVGPDGEHLATIANESGLLVPTDIHELLVTTSVGSHFLVIEDTNGMGYDDSLPYELIVNVHSVSTVGEPNNTPETATDLGTLECSPEGQVVVGTGTIAATNDVDVYRVSLSGCRGGILTTDLSFDNDVPAELSPSIQIVRGDQESPCTTDAECHQLERPCVPVFFEGADCGGFGNSCLEYGFCAGASLCLPSGSCGAQIIERHPDFCGDNARCHGPDFFPDRPCSENADCAHQGSIFTAVPIGRTPDPSVVEELDHLYLVVQDFGSDGFDPTTTYTLSVGAVADADENEPNERYSPTGYISGSRNRGLETRIQWNECARGTLAYENDLDNFFLPHPCPDSPSGCTIRIESTFGFGPVEFVIYSESVDLVGDIPDERASWEESTVIFGGANQCLPVNTYSDGPLSFMIRDGGFQRDFSNEQHYEICFFIESESCSPPCLVLESTGRCISGTE